MKLGQIVLLSMMILLGLHGCKYQDSSSCISQDNDPSAQVDTEQPEAGEDRSLRDFSRPEIGLPLEIDPPYDFDPELMLPQDFGGHFSKEYSIQTRSYQLCAGTDYENEVFVIEGTKEGPSVYVVAGLHGDEIAGWMTGNLLKKATIAAGSLHILSPANPWGASATPRSRYAIDNSDLNRSFPGAENGTAAEQIAQAIYKDIEQVKPSIVLDLHEAQYNMEQRDYLGSSVIFTSLDQIGTLCMDLLEATEEGTLCSERFNFFSPAPQGSINNTVSNQLDIPVLTIETYRGYPLDRRISDQLSIAEYVLHYYGLV